MDTGTRLKPEHRPRCDVAGCNDGSVALCDFPVPRGLVLASCDARLCPQHRHPEGIQDRCLVHFGVRAPAILGLCLPQPQIWALCDGSQGRTVPRLSCPPGTYLALCATLVLDLDAVSQLRAAGQDVPGDLPQGAVVGVGEVAEEVEGGALLKEVVVLPEPVRCEGPSGLWWLPLEVLQQVRAGWKQARGGAC